MFDPERSPFQAALGGSRRIFLHAWRVEFPTKSGARQAVTCPLPDDLAGVRRGGTNRIFIATKGCLTLYILSKHNV